MQTLGTAQGGAVILPPNALSKPAAGAVQPIAVFPTNPALFQVGTTATYGWPAATATLAPGGGPGPAVLGTDLEGGVIAYSGGAKAFGGPAEFLAVAGPGAGSALVPPNTAGEAPLATVWLNAQGKLPATAQLVGIVGALVPPGPPGQSVDNPGGSTSFGPVDPGFGLVNIGPGFTMGPNGTIEASVPFTPTTGGEVIPPLTNMCTLSKGFPWTTGFVTVSQPGAVPAEVFFLSGTDRRVAGIGNLSLVAGSLSKRKLTGPNANRGWVSLRLVTPEPSAVLAASGALAMLGVCHGLMRRRRSR
jgi:hypothetical protein